MDDIKVISEWLGSGSINVFGMPFAGKDTQSGHLAKDLNAVRLGGGEILRNSVVPKRVTDLTNAGKFAPIDDYIRIVLPYLSKREFAGKPMVLSSVGRWKGEEEGVISALEAAGHPLKAVIHLEIDESTVRERWRESLRLGDRGRRADDAEHLLDTRLNEYYRKTIPVLETYEKLGLLEHVNGLGAKEQTYQQILQLLKTRASA